ncbi:hypothetical protein [Polaromonas sp. A23]|uniref:hypothetical protein n=1 Tax=Polaromonas sp. A23 TaxID=1944133 RepID=UPI00143A5FD5|nr:hypothetical protein [Polaromonas sp. A23]
MSSPLFFLSANNSGLPLKPLSMRLSYSRFASPLPLAQILIVHNARLATRPA